MYLVGSRDGGAGYQEIQTHLHRTGSEGTIMDNVNGGLDGTLANFGILNL